MVGIGGKGTVKADAIIYAMRVDYTPSFAEFSERWSNESKRHRSMGTDPQVPVLVSEFFYYFGDTAVRLPSTLKHIIHRTQVEALLMVFGLFTAGNKYDRNVFRLRRSL